MTFRSFEVISAWQSARKLVAAIYRVSKEGEFARDFGLGGTRYAEQPFQSWQISLLIAKASALEVQSHLYAALDQGYLTEIEFRHLYSLAAGCAKQLSSLISFLLKRQAG